jgi:hypothetical protein
MPGQQLGPNSQRVHQCAPKWTQRTLDTNAQRHWCSQPSIQVALRISQTLYKTVTLTEANKTSIETVTKHEEMHKNKHPRNLQQHNQPKTKNNQTNTPRPRPSTYNLIQVLLRHGPAPRRRTSRRRRVDRLLRHGHAIPPRADAGTAGSRAGSPARRRHG